MNKEILWNIINSALAGGLVFLGACTTGSITTQSIIIALFASGIIALTSFKKYWESEEGDYNVKPLFFI